METNKRQGISLIVLVITIIVMIILAAAIILSISNSGIISKAREAKIKNDIKAMQEELNMKMAEMELNGEDVNNLNDKDASEILKSAKKYEGKFTISYGKLYISASATEEEIKYAKELGIELNDLYIYDMLNFDYAETGGGTAAYNIGTKGKLTVTLPENNDIEWFYKNSEEDEFTSLTNDFHNDEWQHIMNYYTGEKSESKIILGYRQKGESKINSKEFSFWQLVAPGVIVDVNEENGDLKINTGKIPMDKYKECYINIRYRSPLSLDNGFSGDFSIEEKTNNNKIDQKYESLPLIGKDKSEVSEDENLYYVKVTLMHDGDTINSTGHRTIAGFYVEKNKDGRKRLTKWKEEKMVSHIYYDASKSAPGSIAFTPKLYAEYLAFPSYYKYNEHAKYNETAFAIFKGWYYDKEFKNIATEGEKLTNDVTLYTKWVGFLSPFYQFQFPSDNPRNATGILGKMYINVRELRNIKIASSTWNVSEDGKKAYHPKYGTTDENGIWGAYIALVEDSGGVAVTYNFDGEGNFSDSEAGLNCTLSGTYKNEDGTDITLYAPVYWSGFVPVVK